MSKQHELYKKKIFTNPNLSEIRTENIKLENIPGYQPDTSRDLKELSHFIHMGLYHFIEANLPIIFEYYKKEVFNSIVTDNDFYNLTCSATRKRKSVRVRMNENAVFNNLDWFKEKFITPLNDTKTAHKDIKIGDNYLCVIYDDGLQIRLLSDSTDILLGYDPDFVRPCICIDLAALVVLKIVKEFMYFYYSLPLVTGGDLTSAWVNVQPTRKMRKVVVLGKDWKQDYVLNNYPMKDVKVFHYIRLFNVKGAHNEA